MKKTTHWCPKADFRCSLHLLFFPTFNTWSIEVDVEVEVEVEQEEKEEWAKPLTQLWQCRPFNLQKEQEYNKRMGEQAPYCSICLLFHTHHQVRNDKS